MSKITPLEKTINRLLFLYLVSKVSNKVPQFGFTKLQKFTFLSEWAMIDKRDRGFCYYYLKFKKGPYSFDLNNDLEMFLQSKIIRVSNHNLSLTEYGKSIVNDFSSIIEQNGYTLSIIDKIIDGFADFSLQELLKLIYSLRHPYVKNYTIGSAPLRMPLIYKLPDNKVKIPFKITKEQHEDLLFSLGTTGLKHWREVKNDMDKPDCLTYEEVFGNC